ncbi:glycosyltransferase family 2 protein [Clostridium manihotivorum]|uniref:Glycosyltransferase family 2 protein n=1 Tax=Clostridium manihotivorum TaxID=2320868 RepID=A0A410E063_9CLOT|nr:glycosyltransferase family 2 protein [Clostridium manihotivorum]QAA34688.1 glycosyltransferase family 2 protein [Clostridium manihotivorum]
MEEALIYIVLLNYNGARDTLDCIESLKKIKYKNYKIVVVDNKSTDDSEKVIRRAVGEQYVVLQSGKNGGFAEGNNLGIEHGLKAGAEYILLINTDTLVEPDFLTEMVNTFNTDSSIGIVGSQINYYPETDKIWFGGGKIKWDRFSGAHEQQGEVDCGSKEIRQIDFMTGCCMLIKREIFEKVGLLPKEYFMYLEDLDFCIALAEKKYKIMYNPNAKIYHKVSASTGGEESAFSVKYGNRNRVILMNKYSYKLGRIEFLKARSFFYLSRVIKYFKYIMSGDKERATAMVEGLKQGRDYVKFN